MSCYRLVELPNFAPVLENSTPRITTGQLPCYPVVRKFLARHYGTAPFLIGARQNNPYASYLVACLERQAGFEVSRTASAPKGGMWSGAALTDTITIGVAGWRQKGGFGRQLSPGRVLAFNRFVRQAFMDRIVAELVMQHIHGQSVSRSIRKILDRYDLQEHELSFDTVLRYYTRKRASYLRELA